jgi:hypothetical protein
MDEERSEWYARTCTTGQMVWVTWRNSRRQRPRARAVPRPWRRRGQTARAYLCGKQLLLLPNTGHLRFVLHPAAQQIVAQLAQHRLVVLELARVLRALPLEGGPRALRVAQGLRRVALPTGVRLVEPFDAFLGELVALRTSTRAPTGGVVTRQRACPRRASQRVIVWRRDVV